MEEQKGKPPKPQQPQPDNQTQVKNPSADWLKSAIDHISETKEDLDTQPTIDKVEFQTTISRSEYQTSTLPTDRILKRSTERERNATGTQATSENTRFRFLYSLTGLLLGSAICLTGLVLLLHGLNAPRPWLGELIGSPLPISDIFPGIVMFIFGIVLIFITRQKIPPS
jgi:hypothetical protein